VHHADSKGLHDVLSSGISPDACNKYGESLLHRVCKASNKKLLQVFLEHGASVQFANDYGRTPLHEVCLATKPCFINFEQILKRDPHLLFVTDVLGAVPLSYIRMEHYDPWIRQLEAILDVYWPRRCIPEQGRQGPPPMSLEKPRSVPLPDPVNALPVELAGLVASGQLDPLKAMPAPVNNSDGITLLTEKDLKLLDDHTSHDGCALRKFGTITRYSPASSSA
jgi:ankyrin repeat protein